MGIDGLWMKFCDQAGICLAVKGNDIYVSSPIAALEIASSSDAFALIQ
jgi:hypothetical protein